MSTLFVAEIGPGASYTVRSLVLASGSPAMATITSPPVVDGQDIDATSAVHLAPPEQSSRANWLFLLLIAVLTSGILLVDRMAVEPLPFAPQTLAPVPVVVNSEVALITPGYELTADLATYRDELFAYLMFDYLRHRPALRRTELLLAFDGNKSAAPYRLVMRGQTNLLAAVVDVIAMKQSGSPYDWQLIPSVQAAGIARQTELFDAAYNLPVKQKLEDLPRQALSSYLQRFIQFKSRVDPRIRLKLEPVPTPLTADDAQQLAGDILTIAQFYSLPLEFFLGIGAMENNYMNVRGDLMHSIWKRRPAKDDVVLQRRRGRVRVLNDSAGIWQITRETLRYAHSLVQKDTRDYSTLPEHLQPPKELRVYEVSPQVLTTYAGILLRDLLDRFDGDVLLATSAYNGGPGNPNLKYGAGVERAAAHARRVLEQAAVLNGESVVRMTWLRP